MKEPTDEQLREYVEKLPEIYKAVFRVFSRDEFRRAGDAIPVYRVHDELVDEEKDIRIQDVSDAISNLIGNGFVQKHGQPFICPTQLGERMIELISGIKPRTQSIPELPQPTWAL
jgi:hypothetical protein